MGSNGIHQWLGNLGCVRNIYIYKWIYNMISRENMGLIKVGSVQKLVRGRRGHQFEALQQWKYDEILRMEAIKHCK